MEDTGPGIPEGSSDEIFEKFQQIDGSSTRRYGGTGLGLSITKKLVELMGGEISVKSRPGKGTVFSVTVPLHEFSSERAVPAEENTPEKRIVPAQQHVLLVEDNQVNQMVARKALEKQGLAVDIAVNGKEGLEKLQSGNYDMVFMDVQMPVLDGLEATRRIRELGGRFRTLPVIALTAAAMKEDIDRCFSAGMDDFLTKPITLSTLQKLLNKWQQGK